MTYILEYSEKDLKPLTSFKTHTELNKTVWKDEKINSEIRSVLLKIAKDFLKNTIEFDYDYEDIVLTGSLSNYNYSKYSDFDLHIIYDFKKINKDIALVKEFFNSKRFLWNLSHDIKIKGFKVELYCQDKNEDHTSSGIFSLMNNEWVVKPEKPVEGNPLTKELKEVEKVSIKFMKAIDKLVKNPDYDKVISTFQDIIDLRRKTIKKDGEYGVGNLTFKFLRRNGYIEKLVKLRNETYDDKFESLIKDN